MFNASRGRTLFVMLCANPSNRLSVCAMCSRVIWLNALRSVVDASNLCNQVARKDRKRARALSRQRAFPGQGFGQPGRVSILLPSWMSIHFRLYVRTGGPRGSIQQANSSVMLLLPYFERSAPVLHRISVGYDYPFGLHQT